MTNHVYAVVSQFPLPADRGDAVRTMQILHSLRINRKLTILASERPDTSAEDILALRKQLPGVELLTYNDSDQVRGPLRRRIARWLRSIASGEPAWIHGRRSSKLADVIRSVGCDAVTFFAIGEASGTYIDAEHPWHWDKMNVLGVSTAQESKNRKSVIGKLRGLLVYGLSTRFERRALQACQSVSVTSDDELRRLTKQYTGIPPATVWPSCASVVTLQSRKVDKKKIAWLGSLSYPANWNGLERFLDTGWGMLAKSGFKLIVIGQGIAADKVKMLEAKYPGVEFVGYVEDLACSLSDVAAAVAPLWEGAGVKMKTLTLMAHGIAVFGTTAAFEGIETVSWNTVFDDPMALAQAVGGTNLSELTRIGTEMQRYVLQSHSQEALDDSVRLSVDRIAGSATR